MLNDRQKLDALAALAAQGFRMAMPHEPGWYVLVMIDGSPRRVWATEAS